MGFNSAFKELMMVDLTRKSGCTSIVLWNILHLLANISKVYSTVHPAFHNPYLHVRLKKLIWGGGRGVYSRSTCPGKTNPSSPTTTNGTETSLCITSRNLGYGKFSLFLCNSFPNVGCKHLSITRQTVGFNLCGQQTIACECHCREDRSDKVLVTERLKFALK